MKGIAVTILAMLLVACSPTQTQETGGFILGEEVSPPRGLTEMLEREGICEENITKDSQECPQ